MSAPDDGAFAIDPRGFLPEPDEPSQDTTPEQPAAADATADGIASLERIEQELADVEGALTRIDAGRYGVCDTCGAPIADARLADHPAERFCDSHRSAADFTGTG